MLKDLQTTRQQKQMPLQLGGTFNYLGFFPFCLMNDLNHAGEGAVCL